MVPSFIIILHVIVLMMCQVVVGVHSWRTISYLPQQQRRRRSITSSSSFLEQSNNKYYHPNYCTFMSSRMMSPTLLLLLNHNHRHHPYPSQTLINNTTTTTTTNVVTMSRRRRRRHCYYDNNNNDRRSALERMVITSSLLSLSTLLATLTITTTTSLPLLLLLTPTAAHAMTPQQASTSYNGYAATYNILDGQTSMATQSLGIDEARRELLKYAYGNVLEVAAGTGINLDYYQFFREEDDDAKIITSLTMLDISEGMMSIAKARAEEILVSLRELHPNPPSLQKIVALLQNIQFVKADATSDLSSVFGENTFDTVVDTFSLCVMGNVGARKCLHEMAGIVKKGGRILLLENTRSSNPILGYYQDITASAAADFGGKGCLYNQNVGEMIQEIDGLHLVKEVEYAAGFFRLFVIEKKN